SGVRKHQTKGPSFWGQQTGSFDEGSPLCKGEIFSSPRIVVNHNFLVFFRTQQSVRKRLTLLLLNEQNCSFCSIYSISILSGRRCLLGGLAPAHLQASALRQKRTSQDAKALSFMRIDHFSPLQVGTEVAFALAHGASVGEQIRS
ncbi:MAG: hypothetical protein RLN72_04875, partial [Henriciella sp.]